MGNFENYNFEKALSYDLNIHFSRCFGRIVSWEDCKLAGFRNPTTPEGPENGAFSKVFRNFRAIPRAAERGAGGGNLPRAPNK